MDEGNGVPHQGQGLSRRGIAAAQGAHNPGPSAWRQAGQSVGRSRSRMARMAPVQPVPTGNTVTQSVTTAPSRELCGMVPLGSMMIW